MLGAYGYEPRWAKRRHSFTEPNKRTLEEFMLGLNLTSNLFRRKKHGTIIVCPSRNIANGR